GVGAAALMLNPWGARLLVVPWHIAGALAPGNITNPEWLRPAIRDFPVFYVVLGAALAAGSVAAARRAPLSHARLAILAGIGLLALSGVRHGGFFFALLPLALPLGSLAPRALSRSGGLAAAAACLAAAGWMAAVPPPGASVGIGVETGRFPERAADFVEAHLPEARLYNDVAFGGYLIWRGHPGRKVFIDGRNEVHAPLLHELARSIDDGLAWRALLDRHRIDGAVAAYRRAPVQVRRPGSAEPALATFSELHFPRSRWALVHWDETAMVFVRRDGKFAPLAATSEYLWVRPEAWLAGLPWADPGAPPGAVAAELERKLRLDPQCGLANELARVYGGGRTPGREQRDLRGPAGGSH
ncbi:MAG TPA: hypothetical protein VJV23_05195, partial [Candidatus Polarisedimenticolia bacterium]|nr:hypothetical protein [Candidatus Polarisedimenticolia bacterium]